MLGLRRGNILLLLNRWAHGHLTGFLIVDFWLISWRDTRGSMDTNTWTAFRQVMCWVLWDIYWNILTHMGLSNHAEITWCDAHVLILDQISCGMVTNWSPLESVSMEPLMAFPELWFGFCSTNRDPKVIAGYFIAEGTENVIMSERFLRWTVDQNTRNCFITGSSNHSWLVAEMASCSDKPSIIITMFRTWNSPYFTAQKHKMFKAVHVSTVSRRHGCYCWVKYFCVVLLSYMLNQKKSLLWLIWNFYNCEHLQEELQQAVGHQHHTQKQRCSCSKWMRDSHHPSWFRRILWNSSSRYLIPDEPILTLFSRQRTSYFNQAQQMNPVNIFSYNTEWLINLI